MIRGCGRLGLAATSPSVWWPWETTPSYIPAICGFQRPLRYTQKEVRFDGITAGLPPYSRLKTPVRVTSP